MTDSSCSCPDLTATALSRRAMLRSTFAAGCVTTMGSAVVSVAASGAAAAADPASSVIVVLSLRGAADGLSLVVPHADPTYYAARPTIAVPSSALLAKDGFFGLHPALAALLPMWQQGKVAAVHATGLAVANRSHFAAMEELEDAAPGSATRSGWLNRLLSLDSDTPSAQGLSVGTTVLPESLVGPAESMAVRKLSRLRIPGSDPSIDPAAARLRSLRALWGGSDQEFGGAVRSAIASSERLLPALSQADRTASYPATDLGRALSAVSRIVRADRGVSVVTVDQGDWDMHTNLGTVSRGPMANNSASLAGSIAAFFADLGPMADRVTLVTITEFGRRIQENANRGLDHGWGNVMFLVGAGVKGGYHGSFPTLSADVDSDLTVTTDYRSVLAEVVTSRTSASVAQVFPGFQPEVVGAMGPV
ncbi:DUF1501 domain-containing protein [Nocardioides sp.]|uniref:DUF1501 domain-containing protein n=1 Tax=Nocardioides sp. TaxID=35761 RepID=UPI00286B836F|nr:DUF1501 domain-containing protein [Nocardioides sp.]